MESDQSLTTNVSELADARSAIHKGHASQRVLSEGYNLVGLAGEFAFAAFSGVPVDTRLLPTGDKGIDFSLSLRFTVDVKTARKPLHLIHERGKPFADIFILAKFDDETSSATLLGWEWGLKLRAAPVRDFGYGVINHYIAACQLRSMEELRKRLFS